MRTSLTALALLLAVSAASAAGPKVTPPAPSLEGTVNLVYFQDPGYRVWQYNAADGSASCPIRVATTDNFLKVVEMAKLCRLTSSRA